MIRPFMRGLVDSGSIAVGYVPVAISFGLSAVYADLTPLVAVLISAVVYAGASQFVLLSLLSGGSAGFSAAFVVLLMNVRHIFYGPALASKLGPITPRLPMALLAAGLTDEVFAASVSKLASQAPEHREGWYVGMQLGAYLSWVGGTAIGAVFGADLVQGSPVLEQTLGFVLPALFLALLLEMRHLVDRVVLFAAAVGTLAGSLILPAYAAIVVGMVTGTLAGLRK